MKMRIFGWVPRSNGKPKVVHRMGLPGEDEETLLPSAASLGLPEDPSERQVLPPAALLIIDAEPDGGGLSLIRYSDKGDFAGDTWHQSLEDAKRQAAFEFGTITWDYAPLIPADLQKFALARLAERKTTRAVDESPPTS
jgi:hypothetical protein